MLILKNIHEHLQDHFDFLLVVVGETGSGKSIFSLQLLETWNRCILKKEVTKDLINNMNVEYRKFLQRFETMNPYEMNVMDEGVVALDSKDHMKKLSKDLSLLFNVFRTKRFFSVVVLPNFFYLNKYFRENRLRGLIWINARGEYKYYTKEGIKWLNANNETKKLKSMSYALPFHISHFQDYKGILREPYEKMKNEGVDILLHRIIQDNQEKVSLVDVYKDKVKLMVKEGLTHKEIRAKTGISGSTLTRCLLYAQKPNHNNPF